MVGKVPQTSCYFRKTIHLAEPPQAAVVEIAADDIYELFVNGKKIGRGQAQQELNRHDVKSALRKGKNVIAVKVTNRNGDTAGLAAASSQLAGSIDNLAASIDALAQSDQALSETEKADLVRAVQSVERASSALANLAEQLPLAARNLTDRLPEMVENARAPIAELSSGLKTASEGVLAITESLPEATANARQLVEETVDSVLVRVSIYTLILIALLALALIAVAWFVYARYLAPIGRLLAPLAAAPEQFAELARHMENSSQSLLELKRLETRASRVRRRGPGRRSD